MGELGAAFSGQHTQVNQVYLLLFFSLAGLHVLPCIRSKRLILRHRVLCHIQERARMFPYSVPTGRRVRAGVQSQGRAGMLGKQRWTAAWKCRRKTRYAHPRGASCSWMGYIVHRRDERISQQSFHRRMHGSLPLVAFLSSFSS